MGDFIDSKMAYSNDIGSRYIYGLLGSFPSLITYEGRADVFFYGIMGRNMNIGYNDPDIEKCEEYKNMAAYPSAGYYKMIGDKMVVKLN